MGAPAFPSGDGRPVPTVWYRAGHLLLVGPSRVHEPGAPGWWHHGVEVPVGAFCGAHPADDDEDFTVWAGDPCGAGRLGAVNVR